MKQVEALGKNGDAAGIQRLMQSKGYKMSGPVCGMLAASFARGAGFNPPAGSAVATNWRNFGVPATSTDINAPGHPFGSEFAVEKLGTWGGHQGQQLATGETGGHVMTVVPGTYDPKTKTAMFVGQEGVKRRSLSEVDLRQAGVDPVTAAQHAATTAQEKTAAGSKDWSDIYKDVRGWEGFHSQAYADVGGTSIGYGTGARPGQSISEPAAREAMENALQQDRKAIESINPNLSEGSKKALSSLLFNLGGDTKKLQAHGMYKAILANDPEAMKKAHVEFSHIHGPEGPVLSGLLKRRQEELKYYDQTDRAAMDRSMSHKVEGTGKIDVNVNAPKGTSVNAEGKGLFKEVNVSRQTQMDKSSSKGESATME
jgi:GH24 family phage-related lysozyme (muramidase)